MRRFYEGHSAAGERAIGAAVSRDGVTWTRPTSTPILSASCVAGAWDAGGVGAPFALPMAAGRWRLYYEGYAAEAATWAGRDGAAPSGIGLALSAEPASERDDVSTQPFRRRKGGGSA